MRELDKAWSEAIAAAIAGSLPAGENAARLYEQAKQAIAGEGEWAK